MNVCIPDNIHINEKNFTSLLNYCKANNITLDFNIQNKDLFSAYGIYDRNDKRIKDDVDKFINYSMQDLFSYKTENINLFKVSRAELLSFVITKYKSPNYIWTENELKNYLFNNFHKELCCCLAIARFWIIFWNDKLKQSKYDIAFVFSGSLIYAKTLLEVLKNHLQVRTFVCETYLTGNEFYLEERYSYIANNSLIKYDSFYNSIPFKFTANDKLLALNKYLMKNNLNVTQPEGSDKSILFNDNCVLIIGQVVNDFSILEHNNLGFYSIGVYETLISLILAKTNYNIIFKAHPWERKKNNLKTNFTFEKLSQKFKNNRCLFVEDFNIKELFEISKHVIVLNSQGGIEAIENGIKPITLAQPFYYNKGFTIDFDISNLNQAIDYLNNNSNSYLSYEEFKKFEVFICKIHSNHLVSKFPSGEKRLKEILNKNSDLKLYSRKSSTLPQNYYLILSNQNYKKNLNKNLNFSSNSFVTTVKKIARRIFTEKA